jgi:hypothetical protein
VKHSQVNDDGDVLSTMKSNENDTNTISLANIANDPLVRIYLILLEVMPCRLPKLIQYLSSSLSTSSNSSSSGSFNNDRSTVQYQYISQPLGTYRNNEYHTNDIARRAHVSFPLCRRSRISTIESN